LINPYLIHFLIQNSDASTQSDNDEIVEFAKHIERILARKKVAVAIVGRIGRPQSELPNGNQNAVYVCK